jgi:predicted phosphodiesterase
MVLRIIGDVHTSWFHYHKIREYGKYDFSVQVGDFGIGMSEYGRYDPPNLGIKDFFIRGNHDDPDKCAVHPNYLGDYGFSGELNIFFLSGGETPSTLRVGNPWFEKEQLDYQTLADAIMAYEKVKPSIVISHECPTAAKIRLAQSLFVPSHTTGAMDMMFQAHKPDLWVFGHYHKDFRENILGTYFICLDALNFIDIETLADQSDIINNAETINNAKKIYL